MSVADSAIYSGHVVHERVKPKRHRLRYGVFCLLLDVDRLGQACAGLRLLRHNRAGLFSIHDADHGDGRAIGAWVRGRLAAAGMPAAGHRILMLCYPRLLGYVFNPLTVYFCYGADGAPDAIVYEVHNTFGGRHAYALAVEDPSRPVLRQRCGKDFYVSPFIGMDCTYDFRIAPPGEDVTVVIREEDREGLLLAASFRGTRRDLSDAMLARMALRYPLMTLKVIAGIHWEALRLWLKGVRHVPPPARAGATTPILLKHNEES